MAAQPDAGRAGPLSIGVDGGGSRCTVVLLAGLREIGRGHGGPANAVAHGFTAATASVDHALAAAFAAAGLAREPAAAACLGLAGAGSRRVAEQWTAWAHDRGVAARIEVLPDGLPAMAGAGSLLVISGTGSIVWGRRTDGGLERCGGRGGLVGDEGSGWSIAIAGLRAALQMADGWGPETTLLARALARFGVGAAADLPATLAPLASNRGAIAAFAKDVAAAAAAGDDAAGRILAAAAADLGRQAIAVARRIEARAGEYPLHLAGGVLCHVPPVREGLRAALEAAGLAPGAVVAVPDLALAAATRAAGA